jgi:phosphoribosylformylglycinamidine synthase
MYHALKALGHEVDFVWHKTADLSRYELVTLPGGFSYGDYLRAGAIARFSTIMNAVVNFAKTGKPVIGICNGFQILTESGLLPGALLRNAHLRFVCRYIHLRTENHDTMFTRAIPKQNLLKIPVAHGEGRYFIEAENLWRLEDNRQIVFRYADEHLQTTDTANPNGSLNNIAGIINKAGNVLGMMPHPERAIETLLGSADGRFIFESLTLN